MSSRGLHRRRPGGDQGPARHERGPPRGRDPHRGRASTSLQNLSKCVSSAGVQIDELVIASLAAAEATLTDTEKELGVIVADIGGGTTDMAVFVDGAVHHSAVIPVGGIHVTNDVAIGLRTSLNLAEDVKIRHGTSNVTEVQPEELINVAVMGEGGGQTIQRRKLSEIIEAPDARAVPAHPQRRSRGRHGPLPAGLVLTGGAHDWPGWPSWPGTCSRCRSGWPPRRVLAGSWTSSPTRAFLDLARAAAVGRPTRWRRADRLRHPLPGQRRHELGRGPGSATSSPADCGGRIVERAYVHPPSVPRLWTTRAEVVDRSVFGRKDDR